MSSLLHVGDKAISEADVIARLKIIGDFSETAMALARDAAAEQAARDVGVSVTTQELQAAYDDFRRSCNLYKAKDTEAWLQASGLRVEDAEAFLEAGLVRGKLGPRLVPDSAVEATYAQNPKQFEFARVSHIVVQDKNAAAELALSLKEEGQDFATLARTHSVDAATRCGGGFRGLITRDDTGGLPSDVADRIFSARAGDVVGPFAVDDHWAIVRVEESGRRPLDAALRERIRADLLEETLAKKAGL